MGQSSSLKLEDSDIEVHTKENKVTVEKKEQTQSSAQFKSSEQISLNDPNDNETSPDIVTKIEDNNNCNNKLSEEKQASVNVDSNTIEMLALEQQQAMNKINFNEVENNGIWNKRKLKISNYICNRSLWTLHQEQWKKYYNDSKTCMDENQLFHKETILTTFDTNIEWEHFHFLAHPHYDQDSDSIIVGYRIYTADYYENDNSKDCLMDILTMKWIDNTGFKLVNSFHIRIPHQSGVDFNVRMSMISKMYIVIRTWYWTRLECGKMEYLTTGNVYVYDILKCNEISMNMKKMHIAVHGYVRQLYCVNIIPNDVIEICIAYINCNYNGTIDFGVHCKKFKHTDPPFKDDYRRYWRLFVVNGNPVICAIRSGEFRWYELDMISDKMILLYVTSIDFYEIDYPNFMIQNANIQNQFYILQTVKTVYNNRNDWWQVALFLYDLNTNKLMHIKSFHVKDYFSKEEITTDKHNTCIRRFNAPRVTADGKYIHCDASFRGFDNHDFMEVFIISVQTGQCIFRDKFFRRDIFLIKRKWLTLNEMILMSDRKICLLTLEDDKITKIKQLTLPQRQKRDLYQQCLWFLKKYKAVCTMSTRSALFTTFILK